MHIIPYFSKDYYNYQYIFKDIIPLYNNGEFLIYSSISIHLFSINGIPICELNLLEKEYEQISDITYCAAAFIYDVSVSRESAFLVAKYFMYAFTTGSVKSSYLLKI